MSSLINLVPKFQVCFARRWVIYSHSVGLCALYWDINYNCLTATLQNLLWLISEIFLHCPGCYSSCLQASPLGMWLTDLKDCWSTDQQSACLSSQRDENLNAGFTAKIFFPTCLPTYEHITTLSHTWPLEELSVVHYPFLSEVISLHIPVQVMSFMWVLLIENFIFSDFQNVIYLISFMRETQHLNEWQLGI